MGPDCSSFVIEGPSELHTKLSTIKNDLKQVPQTTLSMSLWCRFSSLWFSNSASASSPNHAQYVSLVQILVFVVLQQRISTHCTIAGDVHEKVVGKNKDKP